MPTPKVKDEMEGNFDEDVRIEGGWKNLRIGNSGSQTARPIARFSPSSKVCQTLKRRTL